MFNYKKNFLILFQTKSFLDVNLFASNNDHYLKLNLIYYFIYNNSFAFNLKNIPSSCIVQNQKNFFNFLNACVLNKTAITFFSHSSFKNMTKSLNFFFLSDYSNHKKNLVPSVNIVVYLDNKFTNKINSRYSGILQNSLIIKPVSLDTSVDFQIYYLLIDLSSDLNKFIYLNLIKSFLFISKQKNLKIHFKKFLSLKKMFFKTLN